MENKYFLARISYSEYDSEYDVDVEMDMFYHSTSTSIEKFKSDLQSHIDFANQMMLVSTEMSVDAIYGPFDTQEEADSCASKSIDRGN